MLLVVVLLSEVKEKNATKVFCLYEIWFECSQVQDNIYYPPLSGGDTLADFSTVAKRFVKSSFNLNSPEDSIEGFYTSNFFHVAEDEIKFHSWLESQHQINMNIMKVCDKYPDLNSIIVPSKNIMFDNSSRLLLCRNAKVYFQRNTAF